MFPNNVAMAHPRGEVTVEIVGSTKGWIFTLEPTQPCFLLELVPGDKFQLGDFLCPKLPLGAAFFVFDPHLNLVGVKPL